MSGAPAQKQGGGRNRGNQASHGSSKIGCPGKVNTQVTG
jgi:hypothetical protein